MRALAVHTDVIVVVSSVWQTTCTAVRAGDEGFLIDSPVLPDELDALPSLLEQAGFPVNGLLATHGDWDHVLARLAFPEAPLGAGEATARRLTEEVGEPQRRLREFDAEWYIDGRRPLALGSVQSLPVPGRLSIGSQGGTPGRGGALPEDAGGTAGGTGGGEAGGTGGGEAGGTGGGAEGGEIEVYPADGHTADGVAYWLPWASVLVCGDYLSPAEIPMISAQSGGTHDAYRETLLRLAPLVERAELVIPGHGTPLSSQRARTLLGEDIAYLDALAAGGDEIPLPEGRRSATQKRIHAENLAALGR